ncbi:MAG: metal-dependent hydrolase [Candidatus Nezhaarchaeales archaeon]
MLKEGHLGLSLAVIFSLYITLDIRGAEALMAAALATGLSILPDLDLDLMLRHRGATHSLLTGLLAGLATGLALTQYFAFPSGFLIGFSGVALHLIGDLLTHSPFSPLWPFSRRRLSLKLFRSNNKWANRALLALGVLMTALYMLYA